MVLEKGLIQSGESAVFDREHSMITALHGPVVVNIGLGPLGPLFADFCLRVLTKDGTPVEARDSVRVQCTENGCKKRAATAFFSGDFHVGQWTLDEFSAWPQETARGQLLC